MRRIGILMLIAPLSFAACGDDGGGATADTLAADTVGDDAIADTGVADDTSAADDTTVTGDTTVADTGPTDTAGGDTEASDTIVAGGCDPSASPFGGAETVAGVGEVHLLCSAAQLDNLRTAPTGRFALAADIDLTGTLWVPVDEFQGTLLGDGHTIRGLRLDCGPQDTGTAQASTEPSSFAPNCAFFRLFTNGAVLSDVSFSRISTSVGKNGAAIIGLARGALEADLGKPVTPEVLVHNVHAAGHVSVDGDTSGAMFRAVLAGATVENVSFTGTLARNPTDPATEAFIGGLAWRVFDESALSDAAFRGVIDSAGSAKVGGLIHETRGATTIRRVSAEVDIVGTYQIGGLVYIGKDLDVVDARVVGTVEATGEVGGLVMSFKSGSLANAYAAVDATVVVGVADGLFYTYDTAAASYAGCYYNGDLGTSGQGSAMQLSTAGLQEPGNAAWADFDGDVWSFSAGSYPELAFEANIPDLEAGPTFACGGGACTVGAQACQKTVPSCAPDSPSYRCVNAGGQGSVAHCLTHASDPCSCIAPAEPMGWSCVVNGDGDLEVTYDAACGAQPS